MSLDGDATNEMLGDVLEVNRAVRSTKRQERATSYAPSGPEGDGPGDRTDPIWRSGRQAGRRAKQSGRVRRGGSVGVGGGRDGVINQSRHAMKLRVAASV